VRVIANQIHAIRRSSIMTLLYPNAAYQKRRPPPRLCLPRRPSERGRASLTRSVRPFNSLPLRPAIEARLSYLVYAYGFQCYTCFATESFQCPCSRENIRKGANRSFGTSQDWYFFSRPNQPKSHISPATPFLLQDMPTLNKSIFNRIQTFL